MGRKSRSRRKKEREAKEETPAREPWRPSFDAESIPDALAKFTAWVFHSLRSGISRLPPPREGLARLRELVVGADPQCRSETGPARPAMRLLAALYDAALLFLLNAAVFGLAGYRAITRFMEPLVENNPNAFVPSEAKNYAFVALGVAFVLNWLYLTLPESLAPRATLGKKLCSLRTAAIDGSRISFFRANLRLVAKLAVFGTFGLGYLIAVTRKDCRALHDLMTKTQVIKEEPVPASAEL